MIREEEAVERVEKAKLKELGGLDADTVYQHVDYLGRELPGPVDLYQRWERQQWSATEIDFATDREQWLVIPASVREGLEGTFTGFFYGEQAVTDTLSPLLMGAPDEEQRLFLSTQIVDEARHSYFFARFFNQVVGLRGGLSETLAQLGDLRGAAGYGRIFDPRNGELVTSTDAVRLDPSNRAAWVEAITVYHLMVEGLLALTGQRRALRLLRNADLLPGFRAGFTAVTRDESRHVSYGVWALRESVRAGYEGVITAVVDRTLDHCVRVYANPEVRLPDPREQPPRARIDPRDTWGFLVDSLTKRLRTSEVDREYIASVDRRAWDQFGRLVDEYERRQGVEHPIRAWERGEVELAKLPAGLPGGTG